MISEEEITEEPEEITEEQDSALPSTVDESQDRDENRTLVEHYPSFWDYKPVPKGPKPRINESNRTTAIGFVYKDHIFDADQTIQSDLKHHGRSKIAEGNDMSIKPRLLRKYKFDILDLHTEMKRTSNDQKNKKIKLVPKSAD